MVTIGVSLWLTALPVLAAPPPRLDNPTHDPVRKALAAASREADREHGPYGRDLLMTRLAEARARSGDIPGAWAIAKSFRPTSGWLAVSGVASAQARVGDVAGALRGLESLSVRDRDIALVNIVEAMCDSGDLERAEAVAGRISNDDGRSLALRACVIAHAQKGRYAVAEAKVSAIPMPHYQAETLAMLARIEFDRSRRKEAETLLGRALLTLQATQYRWGRCVILEGIVREMKREGFTARAHETLETALGWFDKRSIISDRPYFIEVVEAFAAAGEVDRALQIADSRLDQTSRDFVRRTIVAYLAADNEGSRIPQLLEQIRDTGMRRNAVRAAAFNYADRGRFTQALALTRLVKDWDHLDTIYERIATRMAESGDIAGARSCLRRMRSAVWSSEPVAAICRYLASSGRDSEANRQAGAGQTPYLRANAYIGLAQGLMDRQHRPRSRYDQ